MKKGERGFTLIEMIIACALIAIIGAGAGMTISQINRNNALNNDYLNTVSQVDMAGDWISRDAQSAEFISTEGEDYFINLSWEKREFEGATSVQYVVTYYFEVDETGSGRLMRQYWTSDGTLQETLAADRLYYNSDDPENSSTASYSSPVLNVKLKSVSGNMSEAREYTIIRRPDFDY